MTSILIIGSLDNDAHSSDVYMSQRAFLNNATRRAGVNWGTMDDMKQQARWKFEDRDAKQRRNHLPAFIFLQRMMA